jgi:hypothetical protein
METPEELELCIATIQQAEQKTVDGLAHPLHTYIQLKKLEKSLKKAIENIQEIAIDEGLKYNQKSFSAFGAKIEMKSAPARWDYSKCIQVQHLSAKLKTMQELAQLATSTEMYDEDGMQIEPAKKIDGKQSIAITLEK